MTTFAFEIRGNQEDRQGGNPIPYTRTTQAGKYSPKYRRYSAWKEYVRAAYLDARFPNKQIKREDFGEVSDILGNHVIGGVPHGVVTADIFFGKETHPDPDNVIKGILDALFANDKHIDVRTYHECGHAAPKVNVTVELSDI